MIMFLVYILCCGWFFLWSQRKTWKRERSWWDCKWICLTVGVFWQKNFQGAVATSFAHLSRAQPFQGLLLFEVAHGRGEEPRMVVWGWLLPETSTPQHMDLPFRVINWMQRGWHQATLQGFNTASSRVLEVIGAILVSIWAGMRFDLVSRDLLSLPCGWYGEPYIDLTQKLLFIDFCSNSEGDFSFPVPVFTFAFTK